jgi:hypothetical protein
MVQDGRGVEVSPLDFLNKRLGNKEETTYRRAKR